MTKWFYHIDRLLSNKHKYDPISPLSKKRILDTLRFMWIKRRATVNQMNALCEDARRYFFLVVEDFVEDFVVTPRQARQAANLYTKYKKKIKDEYQLQHYINSHNYLFDEEKKKVGHIELATVDVATMCIDFAAQANCVKSRMLFNYLKSNKDIQNEQFRRIYHKKKGVAIYNPEYLLAGDVLFRLKYGTEIIIQPLPYRTNMK
jgi:hypothetical protein